MNKIKTDPESIKKYKPEIMIGVVARMGVDIQRITTTIKSEAAKYNYKIVNIKVTNFLDRISHGCEIVENPTEKRYKSYIHCCNKIRKKCGNNSIFSLLTISAIREARPMHQSGDHRGIIYIINQLKRPEELATFRKVYGTAFIGLSCHSPYSTRVEFLKDKIVGDHDETDDIKNWENEAKKLIKLDESEIDQHGNNPNGQQVGKAFPKADYILDASSRPNISKGLDRLYRIIFSDPGISPTFEEYGNNFAAQAAYRSIDLSRQVGAAIFDNKRKIVALGSNEVPKAGGGTYWVNNKTDGRDQKRGYDINTIRKRSLVIDIVNILKENGKITEDLDSISEEELSERLLAPSDGILRNAKILDILEYGRALHAEMNAITDAARNNVSTQNTVLFVTTFPCHNCAKHIVGAGIKQVFYLEPYPKSEVSSLYPDSIQIDPSAKNKEKISFKQFCGVTKRRFHYFAKDKLKDASGKIKPWNEIGATCFIDKRPSDYFRLEEIFIGTIKSTKIKFKS